MAVIPVAAPSPLLVLILLFIDELASADPGHQPAASRRLPSSDAQLRSPARSGQLHDDRAQGEHADAKRRRERLLASQA
jgi:hypothetical protein